MQVLDLSGDISGTKSLLWAGKKQEASVFNIENSDSVGSENRVLFHFNTSSRKIKTGSF